jgi:hypothetical protein
MIFAVSTDDRSLMAFATEAEAISHCEGIDVEAGIWLFWDDDGEPMEARFHVPNKRGFFGISSGIYTLVSAAAGSKAILDDALDGVAGFGGPAPFDSAEGVRGYLQTRRQ